MFNIHLFCTQKGSDNGASGQHVVVFFTVFTAINTDLLPAQLASSVIRGL